MCVFAREVPSNSPLLQQKTLIVWFTWLPACCITSLNPCMLVVSLNTTVLWGKLAQPFWETTWLCAYLKCPYSNNQSLGNKRLEGKFCLLIGIRELWWDSPHDWSATVVVLKKKTPGRGGLTNPLCETATGMDRLCLGASNEEAESLPEFTNPPTSELLCGGWLLLTTWPGSIVAEAFCIFRQLQEASHSEDLVLMKDFSHPDIWSRSSEGRTLPDTQPSPYVLFHLNNTLVIVAVPLSNYLCTYIHLSLIYME